MTRRKFSREFKIEAMKLVTERGVTVAEACRDLDLAESVLRRWMHQAGMAPTTAFPGNRQQRPELSEIAALKQGVARLKAERDLPKGPRPTSRGFETECAIGPSNQPNGHNIRVRCEASAAHPPDIHPPETRAGG